MKKLVLTVFIVFQCTALCAEPLRIGTTFSPVQTGYLDMDWKETYLSILDQGFDIIRLGAYWNEIEKKEGVYDFSRLDWQINKARDKGIPVVLTVGMKAPRWPEYFIPEWVLEKSKLPFGSDVSRDAFLRGKTLEFIKKTVNRYKNEKIVRYWQVENEPLNRIGEKHWIIGLSFLKQEVDLVRSLDKTRRPVVLTATTYPNKILRFVWRLLLRHDPVSESMKIGDILGLNVYPVVGQDLFGLKFYFWTTRRERNVYFSRLMHLVKEKGKEAWIMELQAEPWEPGHLAYKGKERPPTGRPGELPDLFREFSSLGYNTIFLWGAEYWLHRQKRHQDKLWLDKVRSLMDCRRREKIGKLSSN
ncbi:MAG: beta-galactosidase [Candidatus Omnitrophota bacterium]